MQQQPDKISSIVSIVCTTYNHEKFIAQTIEGFLMQETNFEFEINICDDCSPDETSKIVNNYVQNHPKGYRIKYYRQGKNLGMMGNGLFCLNKCTSSTSKYIAMCEGDDYWTAPNKLQKQVDFLEANPDYAICFHAVNVLENGQERPSELNRSNKEETYSILDLANGNIMHSPSVVFRNGLIEQFPLWFNESPVGDYVLHLLNARKGMIKYLPDIMAVYRVHNGGTWGQKPAIEILPKWIVLLNHLTNEDFEPSIIQLLSQQKNKYINLYLEWLLHQQNYDLVATAIRTYGDMVTINVITDGLIQRIKSLEGHIKALESTRSYKLAKKLSGIKKNVFTGSSKKSKR